MLARFLLSTLTEFPTIKDDRGRLLPEIALVGRSNVGKSSLINHLLTQKKIAKTSATPGKTRLLNFFCVDERFLLVDLPGYGFAKAPKGEIEKWSEAIDRYLNTRSTLRMIFLLIDSRRNWSEDDRAIASWAQQKEIPLLLIFTKTDKLSRSEKTKLLRSCPEAIFYTITDSSGRHLIKKIIYDRFINDRAKAWD